MSATGHGHLCLRTFKTAAQVTHVKTRTNQSLEAPTFNTASSLNSGLKTIELLGRTGTDITQSLCLRQVRIWERECTAWWELT